MMGGKRAPTSASTVTETGLRWPFIDGQTVRAATSNTSTSPQTTWLRGVGTPAKGGTPSGDGILTKACSYGGSTRHASLTKGFNGLFQIFLKSVGHVLRYASKAE